MLRQCDKVPFRLSVVSNGKKGKNCHPVGKITLKKPLR